MRRLTLGGPTALLAGATLMGCGAGPTPRSPTVALGPATARPVSRDLQRAAVPVCRRFSEEVKPIRVGTGPEELIGQATGFKAARSHLADRLYATASRPADRRMVARYTSRLQADNVWLDRAAARARRGDVPGAYGQLDRWRQRLGVESRLLRELGLARCAAELDE